MRASSAGSLAVALASCIFVMQAQAQEAALPNGDPKSETSIIKQLDAADVQTQREAERDKTTVLDRMRAVAAPAETQAPTPVQVENFSGVPGDPKFEAQLTRMLDDISRQETAGASNDPTIQR